MKRNSWRQTDGGRSAFSKDATSRFSRSLSRQTVQSSLLGRGTRRSGCGVWQPGLSCTPLPAMLCPSSLSPSRPDGKLLALGSGDTMLKLWDVATGAAARTLSGQVGEVSSVAFSPDGRPLASGSADKTVQLWGVKTGGRLGSLTGHAEGISSVAFSPDGALLASGSYDGTVKVQLVEPGGCG